jgi:hypothetical protein
MIAFGGVRPLRTPSRISVMLCSIRIGSAFKRASQSR